MNPIVELQPAWGLTGSSGDDLTSAAAGACNGGGSYVTGEWHEATTTSLAITLSQNECTELGFMIDTNEAIASTTYRFRLVTENDVELDSYTNYPAFTMVADTIASTSKRYSKEAVLTESSTCTGTTGYGCSQISYNNENVGDWTSIAIGTDGYPIIAYQDTGATPDKLLVTKCANADCSVISTTAEITYDNHNLGDYPVSMAIGTDGYPIIAYQDAFDSTLLVTKCANVDCTSVSTTTRITYGSGNTGIYTSIAIGTDGLPVIAHQDVSGAWYGVLVTKCATPDCTVISTTTATYYGNSHDAGYWISMAIGTDGYPVISHREFTSSPYDLLVTKCSSVDCSSVSTTTNISYDGDHVGLYTSIAIGVDGYPIIAHQDDNDLDLLVTKCESADCTSVSTTTQISYGSDNVGYYTSTAIGADGYPVVVHTSLSSLLVTNCASFDCTSISTTTEITYGGEASGVYPSVAIGVDGNPVISHQDTGGTPDTLIVTKQLGLPTTAISYFNRYIKSDNQTKLTRNPWTGSGTTSSAMFLEASPAIEDGLLYFADKAGYSAMESDDTSYDIATSTGYGAGSSTSTPVFVFSDKNATNTYDISATWIGQSSVAGATRNFSLEIYRFGSTSTQTGWETVTTTDACTADNDCTITGSTTTNLTDYYYPYYRFNPSTGTTSPEFWTFWRVYQTGGDQVFRTDQWSITYTPPVTGITVSGTVYSDEGQSTLDCGASCTVSLKVNGADACGGACNDTTSGGAFSIVNVTINAVDDVVTVFLDDETEDAVTITKASSTDSDITGLDLYQNRVIVRHEDSPATAVTITNMSQYDSSDEPEDISFTAATNLTVSTSTKLYVWPNRTFTPGGTITIFGDAAASPDGDLHIATGATLNVGGDITLAGNYIASSTATFTHNNYDVILNATTTGKLIRTQGSTDFEGLTFNGSGGEWEFLDTSATVTDNFTITNGTVTSTSEILYVGGNYSNSGIFNHNSGTVLFNAGDAGNNIAGTLIDGSAFYNVTFDNAGGSWAFSNDASTTNDFIVTAANTVTGPSLMSIGNNATITSGTLVAPGTQLTISGSYANAGTFTHNSGLILFDSVSAETITGGGSDFFRLTFNNPDGAWEFQDIATSTATTTVVAGNLIHGNNNNLTLASLIIQSDLSARFTRASGSGLLYFEDTDPIFIEDANTANNLGNVYIGYSPAVTNQNSDLQVQSLTVNSGDTHNTRGYELDSSSTITIYGTLDATDTKETDGTIIYLQTNWLVSGGTFTAANSTTTFDGTTTNNTIDPGNSSFNNLHFNNTGGWTFNVTSATSTNDFTITQGTATSPSAILYVGGNWANTGGTFTHNSAKVLFNAAATGKTINPGGSDFYDLELDNASGAWTFNVTSATTANDFIITNGSTTLPTAILYVGGDFNNDSGIFNHNSATVYFNATDSGHTITDGGYPFYNLTFNGVGGSWLYQDGTSTDPNQTTVTNGTSTFLNAKTGTSPSVTGGELNVDWYLGTHVVDAANPATDIDTGDDDITVSSVNWFNPNWQYRKQIPVSNTTTTLTNYQVQIIVASSSDVTGNYDVHCEGNCQDDFDDVRFTTADGANLIDHWRETYITSATSTFWVEIPTLPANATTTIYMYYGNSGASSHSNGENTFLLFDHFDDGSVDTAKWDATGSPNETGTTVSLTGGAPEYLDSDTTYNTGVALRTRAKLDDNTSTNGQVNVGFGADVRADPGGDSDVVEVYSYQQVPTPSALSGYTKEGGATAGVAMDETEDGTVFYLVDVMWHSTDLARFRVDGGAIKEITTNVPAVAIPVTLYSRKSADILEVDWILVRKYEDTEPSLGTAGSQEATTTNLTVWKYTGTDWGTASSTQTTGSGSNGLIPDPGTAGAIRIREYSRDSSTTTYYRYNLQVDWQTNFGEYDYHDDYGDNYLISSSTSGSSEDETIGETWYRYASSTYNTPELCNEGSGNTCINNAPTNGSWFAGMLPALTFSFTTGLGADFGNLDDSNDRTAVATTTFEVSTSASNGYVVNAWATNNGRLKLDIGNIFIDQYQGTNNAPEEWNANCSADSNCCGFGYTTNDSTLQGGTSDRFTNGATTCTGAGASGVTAYSQFTTSGPGDPVADYTAPTSTDETIVNYRVSEDLAQAAGNYQTTIIYILTANY
jgi:hypothetical protein